MRGNVYIGKHRPPVEGLPFETLVLPVIVEEEEEPTFLAFNYYPEDGSGLVAYEDLRLALTAEQVHRLRGWLIQMDAAEGYRQLDELRASWRAIWEGGDVG